MPHPFFTRIAFVVAVTAASMLAATRPVAAGGFDKSQVTADAKWVMHFDGQTMRDSAPGKFLHAKMLSHDKAKEKIAEMTEKLGMDPSQDIVDVTLYNTDFQKDRGVVLMEVAKIDPEKALASLRKKHPEVRMSTYEGHRLFTWKMSHSKGGQDYVTSTLYNDNTIVLSSELPKVMEALDILAGKAPALSGSSPLAAEVPDGTIMMMRAIDMKGAELPGKCPVLKQSDSFSFVAGQDGEMLFAHTHLVAESEDVAKNLAAVVEGFRALGALKFSKDKEIMTMLAGLKTDVDGKAITMDWRAKPADLMHAMKKMKKKFHGKHGKHGWWKHRHGHKKDHHKGHDKDA